MKIEQNKSIERREGAFLPMDKSRGIQRRNLMNEHKNKIPHVLAKLSDEEFEEFKTIMAARDASQDIISRVSANLTAIERKRIDLWNAILNKYDLQWTAAQDSDVLVNIATGELYIMADTPKPRLIVPEKRERH